VGLEIGRGWLGSRSPGLWFGVLGGGRLVPGSAEGVLCSCR
jgi:hypothetical protein